MVEYHHLCGFRFFASPFVFLKDSRVGDGHPWQYRRGRCVGDGHPCACRRAPPAVDGERARAIVVPLALRFCPNERGNVWRFVRVCGFLVVCNVGCPFARGCAGRASRKPTLGKLPVGRFCLLIMCCDGHCSRKKHPPCDWRCLRMCGSLSFCNTVRRFRRGNRLRVRIRPLYLRHSDAGGEPSRAR